ncbi:MAG: rRNA maturation RNase YbeY, partial [Chitinophagales bacterium]|nr:rRNA maturation RNase YbeY [Chitinophagales bacterium]
NIQYLNHHTLTDIITFDLSSSPQNTDIEGEIYISIDRVKENAITFQHSFESEISRVIAHGILHLCAYKDKTISEEKIMRQKEDHYIKTSPLLNDKDVF